ncbi:MAG: hypothetical protein FIA95_05075, partial [Gemmatimonadetes bacterium]|nr:hypothetical protein [Gemmatimonadota bacterium]
MKRCSFPGAPARGCGALLAVVLLAAVLQLGGPRTSAAQQRVDIVADADALLIAHVEGPQSPWRGGLDSLSLQEVMERFRVPGVSVAV